MTTNAGAETMNKATIGFTNPRQAGDEMGDIKRLFTPEFRNRLDAIVSFKALDEADHPARGRQVPAAAGNSWPRRG